MRAEFSDWIEAIEAARLVSRTTVQEEARVRLPRVRCSLFLRRVFLAKDWVRL